MIQLYAFGFDWILGRNPTGENLSQQSTMELLINGVTRNREGICENTTDKIQKWHGLTLDESHFVIKINWEYKGLEGLIDLQWLPSTLCKLFIDSNHLTSNAVDLTALPHQLIDFKIHDNLFHGDIDLTELPHNLELLSVSRNSFSGSLNLSALPRSLVRLYVNTNFFTGTLSLTRLPADMEILSLHTNEFHGSLDLTCLPPNLQRLYLHENGFSGHPDFTQLPDSLIYIDFTETGLSGEVFLQDRSDTSPSDTSNVKLVPYFMLYSYFVILAILSVCLITWAAVILYKRSRNPEQEQR